MSGILHETLRPAVTETNVALRDFLAERWKGMEPILFGFQLRQARLDDLIFTSLLAVDSLTGPAASPLGPVMYEEVSDRSTLPTSRVTPPPSTTSVRSLDRDVIVIGGGLAGLTAAWRAASAGASVTLLTKGWGSLVWHAGTIDVLGELDGAPVLSPLEAIGNLAADHPYRLVGPAALAAAVDALTELCRSAGYPLIGELGRNLELPTALGSARRTSLAPTTMAGGDLHRSDPMLIVGMSRFPDLHPALVADNLSTRGIPATAMVVEVETLRRRRFINGSVLAGLFDDERFRTEVVTAMEGRSEDATRIGFPAVLGMRDSPAVVEDLSRRLGAEVFEIPALPPSVPGLRLQAILRSAITSAGGTVTDNAEVLELNRHDGNLEVTSASASRHQIHRARKVILATGGLLGGGIVGDADGALREVVAGLDVTGPATREGWFDRPGRDHPVYRAGVKTGEDLAAAPGVWVTGGLLGGHDPVREGSLEGVALATGWAAGERATS